MGRKRKDYADKMIGQLTLLTYIRSGGKGSGAIWSAACSCGRIIEVIGKDVGAGKKTGCGMCSIPLGIPRQEGTIASGVPRGHRHAFRKLVRQARGKTGSLQITVQDYIACTQKRCIACNRQGVIGEWSDPDGPLTPENLAALCSECATWRRGVNLAPWLEHLMKVARNIEARLQNDPRWLERWG